jgi:hypothetical protein
LSKLIDSLTLQHQKGQPQRRVGDLRVASESDCFFGLTTARALVAMPHDDSMVASEDDHLIGLIAARAGGATPREDYQHLPKAIAR